MTDHNESTHWVTKDGKVIPIHEMSDSHLVNTINFLNKKHTDYANMALLSGPPCFQGEMAQWAAEQEWLSIADSGPEDLFPQYENLIKEADKRGLNYD